MGFATLYVSKKKQRFLKEQRADDLTTGAIHLQIYLRVNKIRNLGKLGLVEQYVGKAPVETCS